MELPGDALYLIGGAALLLAAVLPAVISQRAMSVPMAFLGVGVVVGVLPLPGQHPISPVEEPLLAERLTELCVIVALMGVGLAIDRPLGLRRWASTWRLLAVGMPLFIAMAALLGWWVMGLAPAAAVLFGAVLAPTDPVLASDVQVSGPGVDPGRRDSVDEGADKDEVDETDEVRFALTSEAGLNDGLAFPFAYLAVFLASGEHGLLRWVSWELVGKVMLGALLGWACGWLLARMAFGARSRVLRLAESGEPVLALAATFAVYGLTEVLGGYGFLAVFTAAVAMRSYERKHAYHETMHEFISRLEHLLTLLLLLLFGASLSWGLLGNLTWTGVVVGVLVIFLVRPLTAAVSLWPGLPLGNPRLAPHELRVVSFFGVRGIGSLYYLAYATAQTGFEQGRQVWSAVAFTVVLSVVVHGVAATPAMQWLDRRRMPPEVARG